MQVVLQVHSSVNEVTAELETQREVAVMHIERPTLCSQALGVFV